MGWTFDEFDRTKAEDIMTMLEVWKVLDKYTPPSTG